MNIIKDKNTTKFKTFLQGREVMKSVPTLPTPGPTAPFMCRKSKDGHAYIAARQVPGKGVMCYLAVSTHGLGSN